LKNNAGESRIGDLGGAEDEDAYNKGVNFDLQNERLNVISRKQNREREKREEEERIRRKNK